MPVNEIFAVAVFLGGAVLFWAGVEVVERYERFRQLPSIVRILLYVVLPPLGLGVALRQLADRMDRSPKHPYERNSRERETHDPWRPWV